MRRLFWVVMGITIGALIVRKLSAAAQRMTPGGMADSVSGALRELADSLRAFGTDVRQAMNEREAELRSGTGLDGDLGNKPS